MNTEHFIARRILSGKGLELRFSRPVIQVALLGIALGIAVMIITVSIVTGFQQEIRAKVIGFGSHIQISKYDNNESYEPTPISKDQDFLKTLPGEKGIGHIQHYATKAGIIKANREMEGVVLKGIGSNFNWDFFKGNLEEGEIFTVKEDVRTKDILISRILASKLKLSVHDTIPVFYIKNQKQGVKNFRIAGIYSTGMSGQFDDVVILVDLAWVQEMNGWDSTMVGGFEVSVTEFENLDALTEKVNAAIGYDLRAYNIRQIYQTIFSWLDAQDVNAVGLIVLILIICVINMASMLLILILERTNMIGILKAVGAGNWSIQKIFLINAGYLLGFGMLAGNAVAILLCFLQDRYKLITLDPESYFLSSIPVNIDITHILIVNAITIGISVFVLLLPSLLVLSISPMRAIRFR